MQLCEYNNYFDLPSKCRTKKKQVYQQALIRESRKKSFFSVPATKGGGKGWATKRKKTFFKLEKKSEKNCSH